MQQREESTEHDYPHGRGYGHDYMRGGEVLGGYGYSSREEYERSRGELYANASEANVDSTTGESPSTH